VGVKGTRNCAAEFDKILNDVESKIKVLHLEEPSVPRARRSTPARFCGVGEVFHTKSVCKYFRIEYLKLIDVAIQQLSDRLIDCPGLSATGSNAADWKSGRKSYTAVSRISICDGRSFQTRLVMFHSLPGMTTTETAKYSQCM